jgi:hypothetical protein
MLSKDYLSRVPDQTLVNDQGKQYNYLAATRGDGYALIYTYTICFYPVGFRIRSRASVARCF